MDCEKLIEAVKQYTVLYDLAHPKYSDFAKKERMWKLIAEELKQPVNLCKTKWTNIRDQYRKMMKKKTTISGQVAKKIPKYKYEDHLTFLNPYLQDRPTFSNLDQNSDSNVSFEDDDLNVTSTPEDCGDNQPHNEANEKIDDSSSKIKKKTIEKIPQNKRKIPADTASSTIMKYLIKANEKNEVREDHIDLFLKGIGATMKNLNPYHVNLAKTKIFMDVQELEMQQIVEREQQNQNNMHQNYHQHPQSSPARQHFSQPGRSAQQNLYTTENNYTQLGASVQHYYQPGTSTQNVPESD